MQSFFDFIKANEKEIKDIKKIIHNCFSIIIFMIILSLSFYKIKNPEIPFEPINQNLIFCYTAYVFLIYFIFYIIFALINWIYQKFSCHNSDNAAVNNRAIHTVTFVVVILLFGIWNGLTEIILVKSGVVKNCVEIKLKDTFKERLELVNKDYSCLKLQSSFPVDVIYSNEKSIFIKCSNDVPKASLEISKDDVILGLQNCNIKTH